MDWQPIVTAPQRGVVIVWNGEEVVAAVNTFHSGWAEAVDADEGCVPIEPPPTHWMPLPAPPVGTK